MKAKRLKLWVLTAHVDFHALLRGFQDFPFDEKKRVGFEVLELLERRIIVRYHEQRNVSQSFISPLGDTVESNYSIFISFDMSFEDLGGNRFALCMSSPPKDLKPFVDLLRNSLGATFALELVKPEISAFYDVLKRNKALTRVTAKRIVSGAVTFDIENSYRVDISSTGNAMTKFLEITGGRKAPIDKIKIAYQYDHRPVSVELSRSGSMTVSVDDEDHLIYLTNLLIY